MNKKTPVKNASVSNNASQKMLSLLTVSAIIAILREYFQLLFRKVTINELEITLTPTTAKTGPRRT